MILLFVVVVVVVVPGPSRGSTGCPDAAPPPGPPAACAIARRGLFTRCRDHQFQFLTYGDGLAVGCFLLTYGGLRLWGAVN